MKILLFLVVMTKPLNFGSNKMNGYAPKLLLITHQMF